MKRIPLRYRVVGLVLIVAGLTNPLVGGSIGQGIVLGLDWGFQFSAYTAVVAGVVTLLLGGYEYGRIERNHLPTTPKKSPTSGMSYELTD